MPLSIYGEICRSAKSLSKKLGSFQREAASKFADELIRPNDSKVKMQIKKALLMNFSLAHAESRTNALAGEIEENYDGLVKQYGKLGLLTELAPVLKKRCYW